MPRIASTGDWHLTEGPRFADTVRCLEFIADDGAAHGADLFVVGGDLAGTTVPHRATPLERNTLAGIFQRMANHAPVVIVYGNHDYGHALDGDLEIYGELRARHPIVVVSRPTALDVAGLHLFVLPFPSKRWAMAAGGLGGGLENQKQGMEGGLRAILAAWRIAAAEARGAGIAAVGAMHINIGGSRVGGGEVMIGQEIELAPHDLADLGFDAGLLSHIHLEQSPAPGWRYHGTPARQNFGEQDYACSYNLVDVESGREAVFTQRPTPARRLVTINLHWNGEKLRPDAGYDANAEVAGAEVRVRIEMREDHAASCPLDRIEASLAHAHAVKVERRVLPKTRVRSEAIATAVTIEEKLAAFWDSLGRTAPPADARARALAKYSQLHATGAGYQPAEESDLREVGEESAA